MQVEDPWTQVGGGSLHNSGGRPVAYILGLRGKNPGLSSDSAYGLVQTY